MKKYILSALFVLTLGAVASAQPDSDPAPVPVDGGASLLAAAGVAYGIKKYRDYKKK